MAIIIRNATVLWPSSPLHHQRTDILIQNGKISSLTAGVDAPADAREVNVPDLCISEGWVDGFADFGSPGFEQRETWETGAAAAAAGGFTDVMIVPNTQPPVSNRQMVENISAFNGKVRLHAIGSVTQEIAGQKLAEMYDMYEGGAKAFSDGISGLSDAGVLLKALQYLLPIDAQLIQIPGNRSIGKTGLMHEGITATRLGLPGIPAIAEEISIARDIDLARYTKSALHITGVSTARGITLIRKAKQEGVRVSCTVTPYHLYFTDEDLTGYDTNLKVYPPLRSHADQQALLDALRDGTIDAVASHHFPAMADEKDCEFEYARWGMSAIQSVFAVVNTLLGDTDRAVELLTASRSLFKLPQVKLEVGAPACFTLFNPHETITFVQGENRSKASNNAFFGKTFKGRVTGTITEQQFILHP